jgi:excisionase family DNA binding protein
MSHDSIAITPADPSIVGPLYTTREVAQLLRVSTRTVQNWVRAGTLPVLRYGHILRFRQADLAAFGQVLTTGTPPERAHAEPVPPT